MGGVRPACPYLGQPGRVGGWGGGGKAGGSGGGGGRGCWRLASGSYPRLGLGGQWGQGQRGGGAADCWPAPPLGQTPSGTPGQGDNSHISLLLYRSICKPRPRTFLERGTGREANTDMREKHWLPPVRSPTENHTRTPGSALAGNRASRPRGTG